MESNVDDDLRRSSAGPEASGNYHSTRFIYQQQTYSPSPSSSAIWYRLMWLMDLCTRPTFGVIVALLVIVVMQYRQHLMILFENVMDNGIQETAMECLLDLCDRARAYYQIICEFTRNFWSADGSNGRELAMNRTNSAVGRSSGISEPPPLVVLHPFEENGTTRSTDNQVTQPSDRSPSPSGSSSSSTRRNSSLEPAFLDEKDYPKGWLVYHPTLGVISKEEADKYDRQPNTATNGDD